MSRYEPYHEAHPRNASPQRRRTPPHDARRGYESSSQIRGLASGGDRARRNSYDRDDPHYDDYHRHARPSYDHHSRYAGGSERDFYDDRYEDDRAYDRRPGSGSRSPRSQRQRGRFDERDDPRLSQHDDRDAAHDRRDRRRGPRSDGGYRDGQAAHDSAPRDRPRGEPSREIMLEGLSQDITEEHVKTELRQYFQVRDLESVRIIRNRDTGMSRGFGFLRFVSVEAATAFMDQNYPFIHLYGVKAGDKDAEGTKVSIAFSKERERDVKAPEIREGDWICANCTTHNFSKRVECIKCGNHISESQSAIPGLTPVQPQPPPGVVNGEPDVAPPGAPSQFLIFRNLEPNVTPEILLKGASKLLKSDEPEAEGETGNGTSRKIVSTSKAAHAGANKDTIFRALLVKDRHTHVSWGYGFVEFVTIEEAQAAMAKYKSLEKFTISSSPVLVDYIHAGVFLPPFVRHYSEQYYWITSSNDPNLVMTYRDSNAYVSELKVHEPKVDTSTISNHEDTIAKKRKAEVLVDRFPRKILQYPSSLETWAQRQAELRGGPSSTPNDEEPSSPLSDAPPAAEAFSNIPQQSYVDTSKVCCWLCRTKFNSVAEVHTHERLSKLHQTNLDDPVVVEKATAKLVKHGIPLAADQARANEAYRDRARERRDTYRQPKHPPFTPQGKRRPKRHHHKPAANRDPSPPPAPVQSKGAAILGKMGWSAGQGLGAEGTGMKTAIQAEMYVAGVGLGATGGKMGDAIELSERKMRGNISEERFKMQAKARERFDRLG